MEVLNAEGLGLMTIDSAEGVPALSELAPSQIASFPPLTPPGGEKRKGAVWWGRN
jgi:hypothetical protein